MLRFLFSISAGTQTITKIIIIMNTTLNVLRNKIECTITTMKVLPAKLGEIIDTIVRSSEGKRISWKSINLSVSVSVSEL